MKDDNRPPDVQAETSFRPVPGRNPAGVISRVASLLNELARKEGKLLDDSGNEYLPLDPIQASLVESAVSERVERTVQSNEQSIADRNKLEHSKRADALQAEFARILEESAFTTLLQGCTVKFEVVNQRDLEMEQEIVTSEGESGTGG